MGPLIEFRHVCKTYQMGDTLIRAANDISMKIERGEFVASWASPAPASPPA